MAEYLSFSCGGGTYAVDTRDLRGVAERPEMYPAPLVPPVIAGVFVWRGRLRTAVDVSRLCGGGCTDPAFGLILDRPDGGVAMIADGVGSMRTVEGPPEQTGGVFQELGEEHFGRRVKLIDPSALLQELRAGIAGREG